jgi:hypothetical protein
MRWRPAGLVAAGVLAASLLSSPIEAEEAIDYVIAYDPSIVADTDPSQSLTGVQGFGKIETGLDGNCKIHRFYRRVVLVLLRDGEPISIETQESFSEQPDDPLAPVGHVLFRQERPLARLDARPTDFDLSGNFFASAERGDALGRMRVTLGDTDGLLPVIETNPGTFFFPSTAAWPMEAYWRIVEALRAGETEISFPLGPFGMPGILPPLEDDDGLVVARVIDWPEEPGSFPPPDDEIFSGRKWAVSIEVSHERSTMHAPRHWVVELYESGAPGRWIYDFGYVQILMQPVSVTRESAQNC